MKPLTSACFEHAAKTQPLFHSVCSSFQLTTCLSTHTHKILNTASSQHFTAVITLYFMCKMSVLNQLLLYFFFYCCTLGFQWWPSCDIYYVLYSLFVCVQLFVLWIFFPQPARTHTHTWSTSKTEWKLHWKIPLMLQTAQKATTTSVQKCTWKPLLCDRETYCTLHVTALECHFHDE